MSGASASISGNLSHGAPVFDRAEPPADHHREGASERKTEAKAAVPDSLYGLAPRCLVHTSPPYPWRCGRRHADHASGCHRDPLWGRRQRGGLDSRGVRGVRDGEDGYPSPLDRFNSRPPEPPHARRGSIRTVARWQPPSRPRPAPQSAVPKEGSRRVATARQETRSPRARRVRPE